MRAIIVFVFLASFAEKIVGHPYAQVVPLRVVEERVFGQFNNPDQIAFPEFQRASIPGQCPCRNCPLQRSSFTPNENVAPIGYSLPGYNMMPQRFIRSDVEAAGIPVIGSQKENTPLASNPSENPELSYMRSVRSALEALGLSQITIPSDRVASTRLEVPVDATYRDLATKKTQSQNSQSVNTSPEGYGMYYNMRVQSFNSMPGQLPDQSNTAINSQENENKVDEQQGKILAGIAQLLMGELMVMSQQEDIELLAEREFENQELYLKEIKRLLNIIRKTGDSKEKGGNLSAQSTSSTLDADKVTETSEMETITPTPDTTSTVPTTTGTTPVPSVDDEKESVQTTSGSRRR